MPNRKIKVVYMGTPDFAIPPLQTLLSDNSFQILTIVTQPDQKVGRKQLITPPPLKEFAISQDLPVLQPEKINDSKIITLLKGLKADFFVVVAFGQILNKEILSIPKYGCINIHPSLLPKYRGATPVEEALLHGDTETGVTFIKMNEKLDAGDIIYILRSKIDAKDNSFSLRRKLSLLAASQLPYSLKDLIENQIQPIPQNHSNATYCRKIKKEDGLIDIKTMTAKEIHNKVRAYHIWPSTYMVIDEKRLKILETEIFEKESENILPGQTIEFADKNLGLGTKKGILILKKVQLEGKNPVLIQDFLLGYPNFFKKLLTNPK